MQVAKKAAKKPAAKKVAKKAAAPKKEAEAAAEGVCCGGYGTALLWFIVYCANKG